MIAMTLAEIAAVVGGRVDGDPALLVTGPAHLDSRDPVPDGLFVALTGVHFDGHDHAAGAHAVLGSRPTGRPAVLVRDPAVALGTLARHVVRRVAPRVFAVTGSQGKTSTKDLLAAVVGGVATEGNLNNELGVPLTCLRVTPGTTDLVLEMGARGVGHLSYLADIAPPSVAVVLSVGTAHVGEFGSPALVAHAKGELIEALPSSGVAVLNADDPVVAAMAARTVAAVMTYGRRGEVSWDGAELDEWGRTSFSLRHGGARAPVQLATSGLHQVANAAAAAAMALAAGLPLDLVAARLNAAQPAPASRWRMEVHRRADGLLVVNDAYNANPASGRAALESLVALGASRGGRTVAVLGEMRELGALSAEAHVALGRTARDLGVDAVVAVGPMAAGIAAGFGAGAALVEDRVAALAWLRAVLGPDDAVLVKASRGAALESVAEGLLAVPDQRPRPPATSVSR